MVLPSETIVVRRSVMVETTELPSETIVVTRSVAAAPAAPVMELPAPDAPAPARTEVAG
jgi:hypothetical protein